MSPLFVIFLSHILALNALYAPSPEISIKLFVYGDNKEILDTLGSSYWLNMFEAAFERPTNCSFPDCTSQVELASGLAGPYRKLALIPAGTGVYEFYELAALLTGLIYWEDDAVALYDTMKQSLNTFNPNDIQTYLADYIRKDIQFQVVSGYYDGDYLAEYNNQSVGFGSSDGLATGTVTTDDTETLTFDECISGNCGPAVFLDMYCYASADRDIHDSWDNQDTDTTDDEWDWGIIFTEYMFPNHGAILYKGEYTNIGSGGLTVESKLFFGYLSFEDFEEDWEHNNRDITIEGVQNSFYENFPGNTDGVTFTCSDVAVLCSGKEYCNYELPWQSVCDFSEDADCRSAGSEDSSEDSSKANMITFMIAFAITIFFTTHQW